MFISLLILLAALALLVKSSDWLVGAAETLGLSFGVSPFVIGITIVAIGTSLPELASSIAGVLAGESSIVTGNVIGSNVANICLVLGLTAVVGRGIAMDASVIDVDIPMLLGSALAVWVVTYDGMVGFIDALILLVLLVIFLVSSLRSRASNPGERLQAPPLTYVWLLLGAVGIFIGAQYTVSSVQEISTALGIGTGVIAMSAVALGTSLPEVLVSLTAARRGNAGLAVGNVVGSNIFNSLGVLGIPALFGKIDVVPGVEFSLYFMIGVTVLLAFLAVSHNVSRWEGLLLLGMYVLFLAELF